MSPIEQRERLGTRAYSRVGCGPPALGKGEHGHPGREAAKAHSCGRKPADPNATNHPSREAATATLRRTDVPVEMECLLAPLRGLIPFPGLNSAGFRPQLRAAVASRLKIAARCGLGLIPLN